MRFIPFIVALLVVSPVFAQSRVFTNADLGKPLSRSTTLKPDAAASILAPYQFVDVAPREWFLGPTVTMLNSSPTAGPFGEFKEFGPTRRLDGSFSTDQPWSVTTYGGRQRYSVRSRAASMGGYLFPSDNQLGSLTTAASLPPFASRPVAAAGPGAPQRHRGHPRRD